MTSPIDVKARLADALAQSFVDRIAAGVTKFKGQPTTFDETNVQLPAASIWNAYAEAAIAELQKMADEFGEYAQDLRMDGIAEWAVDSACSDLWKEFLTVDDDRRPYVIVDVD